MVQDQEGERPCPACVGEGLEAKHRGRGVEVGEGSRHREEHTEHCKEDEREEEDGCGWQVAVVAGEVGEEEGNGAVMILVENTGSRATEIVDENGFPIWNRTACYRGSWNCRCSVVA